MKYIKKAILILILFFLACALFFVLFFKFECGEENVKDILSPESGIRVVHQIVNCGATTDYSTSIIVYSGKLNYKTSNVFSLKGYHSDDINLSWGLDNSLRIDYYGSPIYIRRVAFSHKEPSVKIYINGELLDLEKVKQIENAIIKQQQEYGLILEDGEKWIDVNN